jgi:hypothetical protein
LHPRAKDQHARFVERRGALLRDQIHRVEGQLREVGLADVPFSSVLAKLVFCGNAMLIADGSTPYNAVYGRVRSLLPVLPSISHVDAPDETTQPSPGLIRHTHRLREVSIQAMVEGSARARPGRVMNTRATIAAQILNLKLGEEVDVFRAQTSKDTSGWFGPAKAVGVSRTTRCIVLIKHNTRVMEVQIRTIRRHLHFLVFVSAPANRPTAHDHAWKYIRSAVERLSPRCLLQLGHVQHGYHRTFSSNNSKYRGLMSAMKFFAENSLHRSNVISARIGHGVRDLPAVKGYSSADVIVWRPGHEYTQVVEH